MNYSVLAASPVDREFEPLSGQTINLVFVARHAALRRKNLGISMMCPRGATC